MVQHVKLGTSAIQYRYGTCKRGCKFPLKCIRRQGLLLLQAVKMFHIMSRACRVKIFVVVLVLFQVVRSAVTSGAGSTTSGVVSGSLGSREINYILRVLGPAACRNPEVFTETANSCVRIALPAPRGAGTGMSHSFYLFILLPKQPLSYRLKRHLIWLKSSAAVRICCRVDARSVGGQRLLV